MIPDITTYRTQRGVALVMALVFLMLLTMLGVTSMSTSSLEEKMATNTRDRSLAFQAAETALVAGEQWLGGLATEPSPWANAAKGRYDYNPSAGDLWDTVDWNGANVVSYPCNPGDGTINNPSSCTSSSRMIISKVSTQPKYIIERMGPADSSTPDTIAFRITAQGTGGTNAAVARVQSTFVRAF